MVKEEFCLPAVPVRLSFYCCRSQSAVRHFATHAASRNTMTIMPRQQLLFESQDSTNHRPTPPPSLFTSSSLMSGMSRLSSPRNSSLTTLPATSASSASSTLVAPRRVLLAPFWGRADVRPDEAEPSAARPARRASSTRCTSVRCAAAALPLADDGDAGEDEEPEIVLRWRTDVGAGKCALRSMASIVRSKRRKSDSARMRVEGRSMLLESSLTAM